MSKKKVIVFIVEGPSDKEVLYGILSELYCEKRFVFSIVNGDITTQNSTKVSTIRGRIGNYIKEVMNKNKFRKEDIEMVIHLVDTDGIYIPDENIIKNDALEQILYTDDNIQTKDVSSTIERNKKKKSILNCLTTMSSIYKGKNEVPYRIFYMSCNLDHVLYNMQNAIDDKKVNFAHQFEEQYIENPEGFIKFMSKSTFTVNNDYNETWNFIKQDLNSLHRYSNFHLFFNEI